ncbi:hypothetical protein OAR00_00275 [Alphaproteobacteria bacterium]|nr:hypothetical protein [Alphaproteobacteria bacterium]MDC1022969.1 hypothetical protein [Alphaproteobacteria bacterium]
MRFWNYKSEDFYDLYLKIYESNFPIEKKKIILKSLFSGEYCLQRITSISKLCYEEYKKNNFKKVTKFKRVNKRFVRHQFTTFSETLTEILKSRVPITDFWKIIDENEKTHLITRGERDNEEYHYVNIPIEGGYFLNKTIGFEYSKKEELYLKYLSKQRIRWKRMKLDTKNKEIHTRDEI